MIFNLISRLAHDTPPDVSHDLSPEMENPMIPCEFCDALLPMDMLIQHQVNTEVLHTQVLIVVILFCNWHNILQPHVVCSDGL